MGIKVGCQDGDWIHLAQNLAGSFENGSEPSGSVKGG
jgi:hypothetical protein